MSHQPIALVTGGAGFIGSHICEAVIQSSTSRLVIVDDFSSGSDTNISRLQNQGRISTIKIDARDLTLLVDSLVGVNTVIHLASNPDIAKATKDPLIDFQLGTLLTQNSIEAARLNNVKTFIYASGSGIYGNVPDSPVKEGFEPKHPVSCYGASKLAGEAMISAYSHMFGIQGLCFRFANVVGPRQTHGVGFDFIRKLLFDPGRLEILGNGSQTKNYVWVGDVIDAISEKLIRRHPHVFGDLKVKSEKELEENWERIKKEEKGKETRRDPLDGIPPTLPLLARFQKIIKAVSKSSLEIFDSKDFYEISEEALAGELMFFIWLAEKNNIDAEGALRRSLQRLQDSFLKNG